MYDTLHEVGVSSFAAMTPQIQIEKKNLVELQLIRDVGAESLEHVNMALKALPNAPLRAQALHKIIAKALGGNEAIAGALVRQLLSLHGLERQLSLTSEEIFAGLNSGLRPAESDWSAEEYDRWLSVSKRVRELFDQEVVRLSAKALDLSYEHAELLQRARILTDIRPVFNDDASQIRGAVITHALILSFDDIEGEHSLTLSIDDKDILALIRQCERAIKKSKTAQAHLRDRAALPTIVPGKDDDE